MVPRTMPSTSTRMVPSGRRNSCSTRTTVPTAYSSSCDGSATSLRRCAVTNSIRSRVTARSIALMEGRRPTSSGIVMYGNTTTSRSGSSGSRSRNSNVSSPRSTRSGSPRTADAGTPRSTPRERRDGGGASWVTVTRALLGKSREPRVSAAPIIATAGVLRIRVGLGFLAALLALAPVRQQRRRVVRDALAREGAADHVRPRRDVVHHVQHRLLEHRTQAAGAGAALDRGLSDGLERVVGEVQLHAFHLEE